MSQIPIRLNKFIATAGVTSRRKADELIQQGKVKINGRIVTNPAERIIPDKDQVWVEGNPIHLAKKKVYILFNKPKGVVTTVKDEKKRKTVLDFIHVKERIYPVGRLDRNTTGLLLLTNDGELAYRLAHPRFEITKVYHVTVPFKIPFSVIRELESGIILDDKKTAPCKIAFHSTDNKGFVYTIELHQGMYRQIRRMFEHFEIPILKLKRVQLGNLVVKDLAPGKWRYLTKKEIHALKKLLGMQKKEKNS